MATSKIPMSLAADVNDIKAKLNTASTGHPGTAASQITSNVISYAKREDGLVTVYGQFIIGTAIGSVAPFNLFDGFPSIKTGTMWVSVTHVSTGKVIRMNFANSGSGAALQENYTPYETGEYIVNPFVYFTY